MPEVFLDEKPKDKEKYILVLGLHKDERTYKWIKKDYVCNHKNLDCYKVLVPKSNGSSPLGVGDGTSVIGEPLLAEPLTAHTQTFLSIGAFDNLFEAEALLKYIKSKFVRFLIGTLKVTQDNKQGVWRNVPMQDFSEKSDIDWKKSITNVDKNAKEKYGLDINEIDASLYAKYHLCGEEISLIESLVKPML